MDRTGSTTITILILVLALIGMTLGWRARRRRQSNIPHPEPVPAQLGRQLLSVEAFYVSTTVADQELNRIAVFGLGFRSRATVTVTASGIILALDGVPETFVPASRIRGVDRATYTIDRVVEKGGLVRLGWTLGAVADPSAVDVDSYLRLPEASQSDEFIDAVFTLITDQHPADQPTKGSTK